MRYFVTFLYSDRAISYPKIFEEDNFKWIRKVLILAPHPDDEAFWMSGTILFFKKLWIQIDFIWFSNADNIQRVNESKVFLNALWIELDTTFSFPLSWDFILKDWVLMVLEKVMSSNTYDIICLPSFFDTHNDHQALFWAVKDFFIKNQNTKLQFMQYEVWNTTIPNILIDISEYIEEKKKLMQVYVSQLDPERDYVWRMLSLNHYRGLTYSRTYCEAFIFCDYHTFIKQ